MKIIKNIWLLPMREEEDVIKDAELHIKGDTIVYAGPASHAPRAQACDEVIDGGARIAMPGFVNAHAHTMPWYCFAARRMICRFIGG